MLIAQRMVQITFSYNILLRYRVFSYVCTFFHSNRNSLSSLIYLRADAKKFFMIAPRTKILCWMECQIIFVWNVLNGSSVQISGHRRATIYFWAEAVAQLVERSFPNLDVSGSVRIPTIFLIIYFLLNAQKIQIKRLRMSPFEKKQFIILFESIEEF